MDIRGQWSRKNTREISQQDSVDAFYKPIALSLSSYKKIAVSCLFEPRNVVL
jgi:hypothetical protein